MQEQSPTSQISGSLTASHWPNAAFMRLEHGTGKNCAGNVGVAVNGSVITFQHSAVSTQHPAVGSMGGRGKLSSL